MPKIIPLKLNIFIKSKKHLEKILDVSLYKNSMKILALLRYKFLL